MADSGAEDELGDVPDLMNDGDSSADASGAAGHPGSPSLRRVASLADAASESDHSASYGGNVHIQQPAAVGPGLSEAHAATWIRAEEQLQAARRAGGGAGPSGHGGGGGVPNGNEDAAVDLFGNDMQFNEDGTPVTPPYPGYNSGILNVQGDSQPPLLPAGQVWVKVTDALIAHMKPARAVRILIPAALFKRDASHFSQWSMPSGNGSARAFSTAALTSMLFAGTAQGIPCGDHAERKREDMRSQAQAQGVQAGGGQGRKEKPQDLLEVDRYVYIPGTNTEDEWPMWHMGYEEIQNESETDVTFIGVWLWTYDPTHSTSHLISQVMKTNAALLKSQSAGRQDPTLRHKGFASEMERRKKAGFSLKDLNGNFENTVGMQYCRITKMESYFKILKQHAGASVLNKDGAMFVDNFVEHMDNPAGRRKLSGDKEHGFGSFYPASVEFACNAKRAQGLSFGATNLDGTPGDIHPKYLNPDSYWRGDFFRLPEGTSDMWICGSVDRRTIFEMTLPRPLQNQVLPGDDLMYLFMERELVWKAQAVALAPSPAEDETAQEIAAAQIANGGPPHADLAAAQAQYQQAQVGGEAPFDDEEVVDVPPPAATVEEDEAEPMEQERPRVTPHDYARFRSCITQVDEQQRIDDEEIRGMFRSYDNMEGISDQDLSSSGNVFSAGEKDGSFRIRTEKMTDRIAIESTRAWSKIVNPWHVEETRKIENRRSELEEKHGIADDDPRWAEIDKDEQAIELRFANCKKDLGEYHLRCLFACFHSAHDRTTLPEGFKSMVHALESHIKANGDCASMAFPPSGDGMQITGSDRQVFHELMEWLGGIFTRDALIEGRDRFLMDELYLQSFEMYADTTFVLIICSERGKGKSVRAFRLGKLLPEGFVSWSAAASKRAGMNGNMSPNNGCMIIFDEMTSDLTPAEVDERMEFWKQVLTMRSYTIERTVKCQKSEGNETLVTCEFVTDHSTCFAIMTNHGPAFTPGDREPTAGKFAMINRTLAFFARTETDKASPDSAFQQNMESPQVAARINTFRLFTSIVAFCKLAMRKCPWLQPDLGFANLVWNQGDKMLQNEYQMPVPEPRRMSRRAENCQTESLMEAVARVYM